MYEVIGYNKDNEEYISYGYYESLDEAFDALDELTLLMIRREIDIHQVEIYYGDEFWGGSYR